MKWPDLYYSQMVLVLRRQVLVIIMSSVFLTLNKAYSQDLTNQQIWIDFYPQITVSEKLEYYGDLGLRSSVGTDHWNRVYVRPSLRYQYNSILEFHGGAGFFYYFTHSNFNRFEIRPWQGVLANWPTLNNVSFKHLVKLEERFLFSPGSETNSFDVRLRYKISGKTNLAKIKNIGRWYVPFFAEVFYPINDNIEELYRNRGRAGLGIGVKTMNNWDFSILFNWQTSRSGPEQELRISDYAYQIRVKRRWAK